VLELFGVSSSRFTGVELVLVGLGSMGGNVPVSPFANLDLLVGQRPQRGNLLRCSFYDLVHISIQMAANGVCNLAGLDECFDHPTRK
jgi:hypothetical protein